MRAALCASTRSIEPTETTPAGALVAICPRRDLPDWLRFRFAGADFWQKEIGKGIPCGLEM